MYMRDVVETAHIFFKLMERFCNGNVVVEDKQKSRKKNNRGTKKRNAQTTTTSSSGRNVERVSVLDKYSMYIVNTHTHIKRDFS